MLFRSAQNIINKLPQSVRAALYTDIEVDGVTITAQDQSDMLAVMADIDAKAQESRLKAFDKLPDSVHGLVKPSINMDKIMQIGLFLVGLYALSYILSALQGWIMSTITQKVSRQMRSDISYKINRLRSEEHTSELQSLKRISYAVSLIGRAHV